MSQAWAEYLNGEYAAWGKMNQTKRVEELKTKLTNLLKLVKETSLPLWKLSHFTWGDDQILWESKLSFWVKGHLKISQASTDADRLVPVSQWQISKNIMCLTQAVLLVAASSSNDVFRNNPVKRICWDLIYLWQPSTTAYHTFICYS